MTEKKKVSVVIPNYNGIKFIEKCLDSLREQTFSPFTVIVIDNRSEDGSLALIKERYPEVKVLEMPENYGFCRAVNEGIKASDTEYVILLNNDVETEPDFVLELVKAIEKSPDIFSCSAKMLQLYDKEKIDDAGDFYCALGWAFARGKGKSAALYQEEGRIFAGCGGACIYRRAVFDTIGMFDENHFAYLEDIDIGYRARIHGYENRYAPRAVVYHAGSGVSGSRHNAFKVRLSSRNSIWLVYKNMPFLQIVLNMPFLAAGFVVKTFFFARKKLGAEYVKGLVKGVMTAHRLKKVKFDIRNLKNYVIIQFELWINIIRRGLC